MSNWVEEFNDFAGGTGNAQFGAVTTGGSMKRFDMMWRSINVVGLYYTAALLCLINHHAKKN